LIDVSRVLCIDVSMTFIVVLLDCDDSFERKRIENNLKLKQNDTSFAMNDVSNESNDCNETSDTGDDDSDDDGC